VDELFTVKETAPKELSLEQEVKERLQETRPHFAHRELDITTRFEPTPPSCFPRCAAEGD